MSRVNRSRAASPRLSRAIGFVGMLCAVALLASAALALHRSHRAIQRDEDILTGFRSEFESASDNTLRLRAEQRGAMLMVAGAPQYLFRIRRETGPWYCTGVDVNVAVSTQAHDGKRDVRLQKMPVDCL